MNLTVCMTTFWQYSLFEYNDSTFLVDCKHLHTVLDIHPVLQYFNLNCVGVLVIVWVFWNLCGCFGNCVGVLEIVWVFR